MALSSVAVVLVAWSLLAGRLERWRLTAPMLIVLVGVLIGVLTDDALLDALDTEVAQHAVEIVLAVLLFVDAMEVRGGFFGSEPRAAMRVLFVALPMSLALSVLLGIWLLPGLDWAVLLVIACVVVPIDFAPAASILRDVRVPERVRDLLNVEGGYNDGIISPVFICAVALAGGHSHAESPLQALGSAVPQAIKAIAVGVCIGLVLAAAANVAESRGLMTDQSKRMILVAAPLLSFAVSVAIAGNGFVSAFVCGIAFNFLRRSESGSDLELIDDVGFLLAVLMWFLFGGAVVAALAFGVPAATVLFCLLALTLVRILPVVVAMIGSSYSWGERLLVGWLGPRGTTSIVFGLLAFNMLHGGPEDQVLLMTVVVVLGSVAIHGIGAPVAAHAYARSQTKLSS